jgi:hypothetical protein
MMKKAIGKTIIATRTTMMYREGAVAVIGEYIPSSETFYKDKPMWRAYFPDSDNYWFVYPENFRVVG